MFQRKRNKQNTTVSETCDKRQCIGMLHAKNVFAIRESIETTMEGIGKSVGYLQRNTQQHREHEKI